VWIQYFTCLACRRDVSRSGPDPLERFEYCLRCEDLGVRAAAFEAFATRGERERRSLYSGEREKLGTAARAA
jgi:hypothetical protein